MAEIILITLFVITAVVVRVVQHKIYYHFRVVERDKLYRCGCLSNIGLRFICNKYRINTIINLISKQELTEDSRYIIEKEYCRQRNLELINIPLLTDRPPAPEQIRRFLQITMHPEFQPVLVHCEAGVIRTNMMVSVYLKNRFGISNLEIFQNLPFFGHSVDKRPKVKNFILNYQPEDSEPIPGPEMNKPPWEKSISTSSKPVELTKVKNV